MKPDWYSQIEHYLQSVARSPLSLREQQAGFAPVRSAAVYQTLCLLRQPAISALGPPAVMHLPTGEITVAWVGNGDLELTTQPEGRWTVYVDTADVLPIVLQLQLEPDGVCAIAGMYGRLEDLARREDAA